MSLASVCIKTIIKVSTSNFVNPDISILVLDDETEASFTALRMKISSQMLMLTELMMYLIISGGM